MCRLKVEAWQVVATPEIPHGIRYSPTLHEPYGKRIMGYDNSHAVKLPKKFKYAGQRLAYDHKYRHIRIRESLTNSRMLTRCLLISLKKRIEY
ncbi:MAG: hypothetical protein J0H48_09095 [Nitrosospira multiformis]|nr:hypothetical protein [Nitrosospira multiformis]